MIFVNANVPKESAAQRLTLRWRRLVASAFIMAGLAGVAVMWLFLRGPRLPSEPIPTIKAFVDVRIVAPDDPQRDHIHLNQKGALPLQKGDQVRVEVELNRPAFVYVIWIDSTGHATPLYPWRSGRWSRLVNLEKPVKHVSLPDDRKEGFEIAGIEPGMETALLLVRDEVLPPETELAGLLYDLPPLRAQDPQAAVWFEDGAVVRDEADRNFTSFDPNAADDSLLQVQALLMKRLQPLFRYSRAVSFANAGR
jgi:hypothetical protein